MACCRKLYLPNVHLIFVTFMFFLQKGADTLCTVHREIEAESTDKANAADLYRVTVLVESGMVEKRGRSNSGLPTRTCFNYSSDKRDIRHDEQGVSDDLYDFLQVFLFSFLPVYLIM